MAKKTEKKTFIYFVDNKVGTVRQKMTTDSLIEAARIFLGTNNVTRSTDKNWDCRVQKFNKDEYHEYISEGYYKIK